MSPFHTEKKETSAKFVKTLVWISIFMAVVVIGIVVATGYGSALVRKMNEKGIINETVPVARMPPFLIHYDFVELVV